MVVGYKFLLKRIAKTLDSKENLTTSTLATNLNLRQDEFRDILNIMIKKGDIECIVEGHFECGGNCSGCAKTCAGFELVKAKQYDILYVNRKRQGNLRKFVLISIYIFQILAL